MKFGNYCELQIAYVNFKTSDSECEIRKASTDTDQLVQENILLKEQNKALESDLAGLRSALTELNGKLTAAENEKASLLTAIRLLNDGQGLTFNQITSRRLNRIHDLFLTGCWWQTFFNIGL